MDSNEKNTCNMLKNTIVTPTLAFEARRQETRQKELNNILENNSLYKPEPSLTQTLNSYSFNNKDVNLCRLDSNVMTEEYVPINQLDAIQQLNTLLHQQNNIQSNISRISGESDKVDVMMAMMMMNYNNGHMSSYNTNYQKMHHKPIIHTNNPYVVDKCSSYVNNKALDASKFTSYSPMLSNSTLQEDITIFSQNLPIKNIDHNINNKITDVNIPSYPYIKSEDLYYGNGNGNGNGNLKKTLPIISNDTKVISKDILPLENVQHLQQQMSIPTPHLAENSFSDLFEKKEEVENQNLDVDEEQDKSSSATYLSPAYLVYTPRTKFCVLKNENSNSDDNIKSTQQEHKAYDNDVKNYQSNMPMVDKYTYDDSSTKYSRMTNEKRKKDIKKIICRGYKENEYIDMSVGKNKGIKKKKHVNLDKYRGLALLLEAADKVGENIQEINDTINIKNENTNTNSNSNTNSNANSNTNTNQILLTKNSSTNLNCVVAMMDYKRKGGILKNFTGVYPSKKLGYIAKYNYYGSFYEIGTFKRPEEAAKAYDKINMAYKKEKAKTNYSKTEYYDFEINNAKRAFEEKIKNSYKSKRRKSLKPWAMAAYYLLSPELTKVMHVNVINVKKNGKGNKFELNEIPTVRIRDSSAFAEAVGRVSWMGISQSSKINEDILIRSVSGNQIFNVLKEVIRDGKELETCYEIIKNKIENNKKNQMTHNVSPSSTTMTTPCLTNNTRLKNEIDKNLGVYISVAGILKNLITSEEQHRLATLEEKDVIRTVPITMTNQQLQSYSTKRNMKPSMSLSAIMTTKLGESISERRKNFTRSTTLMSTNNNNNNNKRRKISNENTMSIVNESTYSSRGGIEDDEESVSYEKKVDETEDLFIKNKNHRIEALLWLRTLGRSLWPKKRGGGMLWKAFQPNLKSYQYRKTLLKIKEQQKYYIKMDMS